MPMWRAQSTEGKREGLLARQRAAVDSEKGTHPKTSLPTSIFPSSHLISLSESLKVWLILGDIADSRSGAQNVLEGLGNQRLLGSCQKVSRAILKAPHIGQR